VTYKTQLILTVGSGERKETHLDRLSSAITPHFVIKLCLGKRGN